MTYLQIFFNDTLNNNKLLFNFIDKANGLKLNIEIVNQFQLQINNWILISVKHWNA